MSLTLPPGTYLLQANVSLYNAAGYSAQDNTRVGSCRFSPGEAFNDSTGGGNWMTIAGVTGQGFSESTLSFHSVLTISGKVDVLCVSFGNTLDPTNIYVAKRRLTALKVDVVNVQ